MIRVADKNHRGKYGRAKTGVFLMKNPGKFMGSEKPEFKSSLEYSFMKFCDDNDYILKWGYETAAPIKYLDKSSNPPKIRRYYVDFVCVARIGSGTKTLWVEIKPKSETVAPSKRSNVKTQLLWLKNTCKWEAARVLAKSKGYEFKILTEEELR